MIRISEVNDRNLYSSLGGGRIMNVISLKAVLQISYKDSLHGPSGLAWIKRYLSQLLLVEVGSMTACIHSAIPEST